MTGPAALATPTPGPSSRIAALAVTAAQRVNLHIATPPLSSQILRAGGQGPLDKRARTRAN